MTVTCDSHYVTVPTVCCIPIQKSLKRQAITSEIDVSVVAIYMYLMYSLPVFKQTAAKKAKQIDKDLTSLRAATREKAQIQLIEVVYCGQFH